MIDWIDKEVYYCLYCKHRWILTSTKDITTQQHINWLKKVVEQHKKMKEE